MKNYIKKVRKYNESRLMTQAQLAKKAGISRTTLAMIENGKADPDGKTIAKIAKALNYPVYELFPDFCQRGAGRCFTVLPIRYISVCYSYFLNHLKRLHSFLLT